MHKDHRRQQPPKLGGCWRLKLCCKAQPKTRVVRFYIQEVTGLFSLPLEARLRRRVQVAHR